MDTCGSVNAFALFASVLFPSDVVNLKCEEQFGENPSSKMLDCPMGAMTSTLEKLLITQEFYTEGYGHLKSIGAGSPKSLVLGGEDY